MHAKQVVVSPHCSLVDELLILRVPGGTRTLSAELALLQAVLTELDGSITATDWINRHKDRWDPDRLTSFMTVLQQRGFVIEVAELSQALWSFASNPNRSPSAISGQEKQRITQYANRRQHVADKVAALEFDPMRGDFTSLLQRRRTHRSFGTAALPVETIATILWSAYGITGELIKPDSDRSLRGRTVPSAGALHPLSLYLINLRATPGLDVGNFQVECQSIDEPVRFEMVNQGGVASTFRCFGNPALAMEAQAAIVITGDFALTAQKYGTRALAYVAVEAGHAAQNALLMATALGAAAVQTGEFEEAAVASTLGLASSETPLVVIFVGSFGRQKAWPPKSWKLEWTNHAGTLEGSLIPERYTARVRVAAGEAWAWGSGSDARLAAVKAYSEAEERHRTGFVPALACGRFIDLPDALDPTDVIALSALQYGNEGIDLTPFDPMRSCLWTKGRSLTRGIALAVLADLVYFRPSLDRYARSIGMTSAAPYAFPPATSSGVAAHPSWDIAVRNATLELIERDAFMLAWLCFTPATLIDLTTLPEWARSACEKLHHRGVQPFFRDISTEFGLVFLAFAQSDTQTFTRVTCGAGLSRDEALCAALNELLAMVDASLAGWKPALDTSAVAPSLHAAHYHQADGFRDADRLVTAPCETISYGKTGRRAPVTWNGVLFAIDAAGYDLITVELSGEKRHDNQPNVVRAIIPGLLPLTFGARFAPLGLDRFKSHASSLDKLQRAELLTVPHPLS